jgi:hypothetical protein
MTHKLRGQMGAEGRVASKAVRAENEILVAQNHWLNMYLPPIVQKIDKLSSKVEILVAQNKRILSLLGVPDSELDDSEVLSGQDAEPDDN